MREFMSLRQKVMSGGLYLAMRQGIGMVVSLGGTLTITRLIGPQNYGLYATIFGIFWYVQTISQLGIEVYLVREEEQDASHSLHQAFTLLLLLGIGGFSLSIIGLPFLGVWLKIPTFFDIAKVMFLGLPLVLITQVPAAILERALDYRRVAFIELSNQITFFLVSIILAVQGYGVWAPLIGWWVQQIQCGILSFWITKYRPQFYWNRPLVRSMLGYSMGFSTSIWIWYARSLVNPLLVGHIAGAEAVAFVAIAIRLVEALSFVKTATWRLSIAVFAKFQKDSDKLLRAVTEGMGLQVLALGPLLVLFVWISPWFIRIMFGDRWLPVIDLLPFISLSYLTNALFNMHSSALYVLQKNREITVFHSIHILIFLGANLVLLPRFGIIGYGWAEIPAILSYFFIHLYLVKFIGRPDYKLPVFWFLACAIALFSQTLGWWSSLGFVVVLCMPSTYTQIQHYLKNIRQ
jgi:O-antigen/teichoic acid export membrane protein